MSKLKRPVNVLIFEIILTAQILINNPVLVGIDLKPKKVFMIFGYEWHRSPCSSCKSSSNQVCHALRGIKIRTLSDYGPVPKYIEAIEPLESKTHHLIIELVQAKLTACSYHLLGDGGLRLAQTSFPLTVANISAYVALIGL